MAKMRAYKLAEELGIDKNEFVEKARALGFQLKSPMVALEPEEAERLRAKLGGAADQARVEEERVEGKTGSTILRRRRRKVEPPPEPPKLEVVEPEVAPDLAAAVAVDPESISEPEPDLAAAAEPEPPVELEAVPEPPVQPAVDGESASEPAAARKRAAATPPAPAFSEPAANDRKGRQRKRVREVVNLREQDQVKLQFTGRGGPQRRPMPIVPRAVVNPRSRRRDKLAKPAAKTARSEQRKMINVEGEIGVGELAKELGVKAPVIQGKLMALGIMVSVNHKVDVETCRKVADELGHEIVDTGFKEETYLEAPVSAEEGSEVAHLQPRSPVITVMGHVDHGKTSLLDAIRETKVVDGEAGGITQHIGAYQVDVGGSMLTFIDTPGHEAFTAMRARGAAVTDLVVLVVAATEGVMPQTVEAIEHARAASCPILVAVNKCDLPGANPQQIRQRLMEHDLVAEDFGGDIICVDVSAKTGAGLDHLLEMLSLQSEVLELEADPQRRAMGVTLESRLSKGRGPVATVLVQDGTLRRGDIVVIDRYWGRVRVMENDLGKRVKEAGPSVPIQLVGLSGVPAAGSSLHAVESERVAKRIIDHREDKERGEATAPPAKLTLEEFFARAEGEGAKHLSVVLKADVQGTCEAVRAALEKLSTDAVTVDVLSAGVGGITENDVMLAKASDAIVVGFNVRPDPVSRRAAEGQGVDIRSYTVIYELVDEVRTAMAGLLPPTVKEVVLGQAEVRQPFSIPKIGTIAGSFVSEGLVRRNARCRLIRDGTQVYEGRVGSLRRFKEDVREVKTGFECGIGIEGYNDVKAGDVIEAFELEEHAATL